MEPSIFERAESAAAAKIVENPAIASNKVDLTQVGHPAKMFSNSQDEKGQNQDPSDSKVDAYENMDTPNTEDLKEREDRSNYENAGSYESVSSSESQKDGVGSRASSKKSSVSESGSTGLNESTANVPHETKCRHQNTYNQYNRNRMVAAGNQQSMVFNFLTEVNVMFIGIHFIFAIGYFIFDSVPAAIISLLVLLTATFAQFDRNMLSYVLTGLLSGIIVFVLITAVSTPIDGLESLSRSSTVRGIAISHIPLSILLGLLSFKIAAQIFALKKSAEELVPAKALSGWIIPPASNLFGQRSDTIKLN